MLHRNHFLPTFVGFLALTLLAVTPSVAQFAAADFTKLNRFVQGTNASDKALKTFRVGRDLIEDEKWEQAEKQFRDFLRDYPKHNQADAAIYWLAFTQKKQRHFSEAETLLVQLENNYPKSSWVSDAKALRLEIAPALGNVAYVNQVISETNPAPRARAARSVAATAPASQDQAPTPSQPRPATAPVVTTADGRSFEIITPPAGFTPIAPIAPRVAISGDHYAVTIPGQSSANAMDEKDEIKAIALQSLMQSNPERALPYIGEMLKNDSKASKGLKEVAVRLLGQYRGPNSTTLLLDLARNQTDPRLRRSAIYSLSNVEDDKVFDLLLDLATKSEDPEIAKTALRALANHRSQKAKDSIGSLALNAKSLLIRRDAMYFLGERKDDASIERLISIYDNDADPEIKKHAIYALSRSGNPKARQKLMEVARSNGSEDARAQAIQWLDDRADESFIDELVKMYQADKSAKVRKQIIYSLLQIASDGTRFIAPMAVAGQSVGGVNVAEWRNTDSAARTKGREKAAQALLKMYDAESDDTMKSQLLFAFSQSRSKEALQKLMQVAKTDSSIKMRTKAVSFLGQSRDPEAVKFLEELLK